jgi:hypothetical protein
VAYFNAGVRLVDLADPYNPREVGYDVPKPNEKVAPGGKGAGVAIQMNDVDLDDRGLAYATDRTGRDCLYFSAQEQRPDRAPKPVTKGELS